ncbi:peptidase M10A and M12B matrixin and adamalysin [Isosphaera pallida ATCC 43644]|uniref:Peptidase M10A and M12B matrixin and adamalysin n=1 Tax=Isosphaera pallida (strain ATCC 43644 / DSM 9630 / IS1B) TaxID=575540 RepID=E8QY87_ISOPI|nr:matrixin family metalloprotease [Isosphaera pallida]ADV63082.1 peptidase M10A and M12B matrixin and adamalysin [Isosphaera pallida ATCC 43644]
MKLDSEEMAGLQNALSETRSGSSRRRGVTRRRGVRFRPEGTLATQALETRVLLSALPVVSYRIMPDGFYDSRLHEKMDQLYGPGVWQEAIASAARTWSEVGVVELVERSQAGGTAFSVMIMEGGTFSSNSPGLAVRNQPGIGQVYLNVEAIARGNVDLQTLMLHEFGHVLGLEHINDGTSVMAPSYNGVNRVLSSADQAALRAIWPRPVLVTSVLNLDTTAPEVGRTVTLTTQIRNPASVGANPVQLRFALPGNVRLAGPGNSNAWVDQATGEVVVDLGRIPPMMTTARIVQIPLVAERAGVGQIRLTIPGNDPRVNAGTGNATATINVLGPVAPPVTSPPAPISSTPSIPSPTPAPPNAATPPTTPTTPPTTPTTPRPARLAVLPRRNLPHRAHPALHRLQGNPVQTRATLPVWLRGTPRRDVSPSTVGFVWSR